MAAVQQRTSPRRASPAAPMGGYRQATSRARETPSPPMALLAARAFLMGGAF